MSLARFLNDLFESGRVVVDSNPAPPSEPEVEQILVLAERVTAPNLAGHAPPFSLQVAQWAARMLYGGCQFLVCRDTDAGTINSFFQEACPEAHSPRTDYSADLVLQYLPDLVAMTRGIASGDPLLQHLLGIARAWPLSSVGIADVGSVEVNGFIEHPSLRSLYVDRIIARVDKSRLGDPRVDNAVREALGAFPTLCQPLADILAQPK